MGCGSSKLEEQEAVTHCRERSTLLADAIRYRYALADAHGAYMRAVESLGPALSAFLIPVQGQVPPSPLLTLPPQRKGDPSPLPVPVGPVQPIQNGTHNRPSHSRSHSDGSHIQFHSSDSESEHGSHIHFHSDEEEDFMDPQPVSRPNPTRFNMHYAKSQPPNPSVSYEQRLPENPQTVYPSYYNNDPYQPESSTLYPPSYPSYTSYPSYPSYSSSSYSGYGEPSGGFIGNFAPPTQPPPPREEIPPPAPPSPPHVSTWDFLNPFESYDSYYAPPYTPSRSSKEVRDEEGIPDLEDEHEVVKAAYGDEKAGPSFVSNKGKGKGEKGDESGSDPLRNARDLEIESTSTSNGDDEAGTSGLDHEIHVVDKNVVKEGEIRNVSNLPVPVMKTYSDDSEVVREIKSQFDRVYESANQVSKLLEVGKQPYQQKNSPLKDSLRMMCGLPSISGSDEDFLNFEEDKAISSTLQKLYMWEKKLLEEVKTEEKMRVLYDRKRQELRYLDERGAEPLKIEQTEKFIRKLSTRISIAMQIVSTISDKISALRDEELWPQICDFIQGLTKMWAAMSESHRIQHQAISSFKNLDSILSAPHLSSTHRDATKTLELRLVEWTSCFSSWISLQKSYVRTLNDWLVKGLHYQEEITEDGPVPFSPGRLGAPIIFGVLNQWASNLEMVSEREVGIAMRELGFRVLKVWEGYQFEQRQSLMANKEGMDRALRVMEKEEQEMRELGFRVLKVGELEGNGGEGEGKGGSVKGGLERVFEEMRGFCEGLVGVYEGLCARIEEEKSREE